MSARFRGRTLGHVRSAVKCFIFKRSSPPYFLTSLSLLSREHVLSTQGPSQVSGLFLSNCLVGIASSQLQGYPVSQL